MQTLKELIEKLPPELQQEVQDFVEFLLEKRARRPKRKPKFTELGVREDGLGEKEALPKMKGVVQARRYIGDLVRVLLGKEGQGTLKAHMVRGTVGTFP